MHLIITDNKKPQTNTDKSPERNREILEIILCFFLLVSLIFILDLAGRFLPIDRKRSCRERVCAYV